MSIKKIRTIFISTPDFGIPALRALIEDKQFDIVAVITQPDKKVGRKQIITPPPIKVDAKKHKIPVWQPEQISACLPVRLTEQVGADRRSQDIKYRILDIDLIVVIAYAQLIPEKILDMPKYGCINVHGSLLPKYRGAACIQAAILNGDRKTGVTIMKIDKGLDTGPILSQKEIHIKPTDTAGTLYQRLSGLGAELLILTLKKYIAGEIKLKPQNSKKASYVKKLKKQDGHINWTKSAPVIERFIRAMTPWPGAYAKIKNKKQKIKNDLILKIIEVEHESVKINGHKTGELLLHNQKLAVQCGQDALIIRKVQLAGKKQITAKEFIHGYKNLINTILH